MFTGIIEGIGRINAVEESQQGRRIHIALGTLAADGCDPGASVSVNGICLTVSERQGELAAFDLSAETLARSTAGAWRSGDAVNLERALALGQRLGGHLVGGHVDGVGRVLDRRSEGECLQLALELPEDGSVRVVEKGSVTVDGISLTVCQPDGRRFAVALIPETLRATTIGERQADDLVNLEQDMIGRWIQSLVETG